MIIKERWRKLGIILSRKHVRRRLLNLRLIRFYSHCARSMGITSSQRWRLRARHRRISYHICEQSKRCWWNNMLVSFWVSFSLKRMRLLQRLQKVTSITRLNCLVIRGLKVFIRLRRLSCKGRCRYSLGFVICWGGRLCLGAKKIFIGRLERFRRSWRNGLRRGVVFYKQRIV